MVRPAMNPVRSWCEAWRTFDPQVPSLTLAVSRGVGYPDQVARFLDDLASMGGRLGVIDPPPSATGYFFSRLSGYPLSRALRAGVHAQEDSRFIRIGIQIIQEAFDRYKNTIPLPRRGDLSAGERIAINASRHQLDEKIDFVMEFCKIRARRARPWIIRSAPFLVAFGTGFIVGAAVLYYLAPRKD